MSRAAVRAALMADLPAGVDGIVSTIRAQIPAYDALSEDQLAEVTAIASWGLDRVLDLWVEGQDLSPADLNRFQGIGAVRALDGRPLPGILRAYRLAGRTITDMITRTADDNLSVADAMALANLWMSTIDSLSEALYTGHSHASDRVADDRESALADLLSDLLAGRQVTLTALTDRSKQLGISLPAHPAVVVLQSAVASEPLTMTGLGRVLSTAGLLDDESVLRFIKGTRAVVLCQSSDVPAIRAATDAPGVRGCAVQASRTSDVNRAHQLADLCLDLAPAHAYDDGSVLVEGDAQVLALVTANPVADPVRAANQVLGGVDDAANLHILEGLDAYLATGSATTAAEHLGLHAQSMRYRLRRLRDLTGRDPRQPWDRFVLETARRAMGSTVIGP